MSTPHAYGTLPVTDGHTLYWQAHGNPDGRPALVLHGGPGAAATPGWTTFFDTTRYRVILLDQRGSGRSTPDAADPTADLTTNTTRHLVADIEALRHHLGIDTWLVLGGSWGTTLALAYALTHPEPVRAMVLFALTTTTPREVTWITHDMRRVFPEQWERFAAAAGPGADPRDLSSAYARLLADPDPQVRFDAARAWCEWEDTHVSATPGFTPNARFTDPAFRMTFARLVTHYWSHAAFLPPGHLLAHAPDLAHIPATLVHGRLDISGPADIAYDLATAWPGAELVIVEGAGHSAGTITLHSATRAATDRYADLP
ncbi:proline iminopeptidase [Nocardiopsis sp. Huas11]|uniref:prolyl aminopeptidase n=1 Tax=Nocardiopsis sp. Huas11 TaxID=2183912 RepID=UPI000EB4F45C|nr:prolyl aminopeptidase [Nocardiopsis sp. Huas11]RKS08665.1 proline iminopeptidase [Nocardiopsis sp. Huas11]